MGVAEFVERGEFDDGLNLLLEQRRKYDHIRRRGFAQAGCDLEEVGRNVVERNRAFVRGALANQTFTQVETLLQRRLAFCAIGCGEFEIGVVFAAIGHIENAILGVHERRQLRHDHARNGGEIALALKHS